MGTGNTIIGGTGIGATATGVGTIVIGAGAAATGIIATIGADTGDAGVIAGATCVAAAAIIGERDQCEMKGQ